MNKPICVLQAPIFTRSGYGDWAESIAKSLLRYDKFDLHIVPTRWGSCSKKNIEAEINKDTELQALFSKILRQPLQKQPEVFIQCTIPNEFQPVGQFNIGMTAGIETTLAAPAWIEGLNRMQHNIATSIHAKSIFDGANYSKNFQDGRTEQLKLEKPCDVLFWGANTSIFKKTDVKNQHLDKYMSTIKENFAFLFVGQWTANTMAADRKDIGMLIKTFIESFRDVPKKEQPCLILKTNGATLCKIDKYECINRLKSIYDAVGNSPDNPNVYILHGEFTDEEMNALYNHEKIKAHVSFTHGEGFCGLDYTPIITNKGIRRLDSIKIGDMVLTHKNRFMPVTKELSRDYTGAMYKITPFNSQNKEPIVLTGNHRVYIFDEDDNQFKWVAAENLKIGNLVCIPKPTFSNNTQNDIILSDYIKNKNIVLKDDLLHYSHSNKKYTPIQNKLQLTPELGKILGYFLAEGHYCKTKGSISFSLNKNEEKTICNEIIECFNSVFGITDHTIKFIKNTEKLSLFFYNKIVGEFLANFCGESTRTKFINSIIFNTPLEFKQNIITSLFLGDGHIKEKTCNSSIEISLVNDKILRSVKLLLLENGIISDFDHFVQKGIIKNTWVYESHVERLCITNIESFNALISIINTNHSFSNTPLHVLSDLSKGIAKSKVQNDYIITEIKNIEEIQYSGKVFNLSVQEDESYCTENFMVHNCHPALLQSLTGKPMLYPNWSGHLDFLDPKLCKLLPGELKQVPGEAVNEWFVKESSWFNVNYPAAGEIMKNVFSSYKNYITKAEELRKRNEQKFSIIEMDKTFHEMLDRIVPKFSVQQTINLPKLKKITLPLLKKVEAPPVTETKS